ncbi:PrsW family intramembrane metalloprotease [Corynebacterium diphtheriae]|nr:PrsW family intramembrane metalloprotease [Corynebacterium diphtheriae]CAB0691131.1 PrsW family intramembrane metalloprotease [Corynebacterium diphtheriae]CAB0719051.1 PrsW family intramembrane metalloprotease [Corynebacterium diphtheriae]CAB0731227.1 PrsW family intramembrane metalloprotease [Corynebacterium diphtheriae]CAB0731248.1 PrsW family intramembrane metalloprotease [Corynebacterium diphtheriae]
MSTQRAQPASISWVLWTLIGISIPVIAFFTFANFFASPIAAFLGVLFGLVYFAVGTALFFFSPMWPTAGWKWYFACIGWGAGASFCIVMLSAAPFTDLTDKLGWEAISASFAGAYPEEIAKSLGVLLILFTFSKLTRPWHGFVTGAMIGLGFEVFENISYGVLGAMSDPNTDITGALYSWGIRSIAGPGLHVAFTAIAGYGIGLAVFRYGWDTLQRFLVGLCALGVAFFLHFTWNLQFDSYAKQIANFIIVALILYPLMVWLWLRCHRQAKNDLGVVRMKSPITTIAELQRRKLATTSEESQPHAS